MNNKKLIYYDLETTGLRKPQITQIGALNGNCIFSVYVCPRKKVEQKAVEITGLKKKGNRLFEWGEEVDDAVPIREGLEDFIEFLEEAQDESDKDIVLVGHNIASYDNSILMEEARYAGVVRRLNGCVDGYIDTLEVFRREKPLLPDYKQSTIVRTYMDPRYQQAHEAVADVKVLKKVVNQEFTKSVLGRYIKRW